MSNALGRNLARVGYEIMHNACYWKGYNDGLAVREVTRRQRAPKLGVLAIGRAIGLLLSCGSTVTRPCPHCGEDIEIERVWAASLGKAAEDREHAAEIWRSWTAGAHGHDRPCARCAHAFAVRGDTLCCDCQAQAAGVS